jgi:AraC-like DNA-binding protein/TolB-like protein
MNLAHSSDSEFIRKLSDIVLENLENENFGVDELASLSGMGVNTLRHRLKILTQKTITQFIHEIRLNKAHQLLQENTLTVSEVAWKTGFGSPEYFIRCYHDFYGYSPGGEKRRNHVSGLSNDLLNITENVNKPAKTRMSGIKYPVVKKILYSFFGLIVLLVLGDLVYTFLISPTLKTVPKRQEISIAVLPFINDSPDTNHVYFFNRLTEMISEKLTETGSVAVTPRRTVEGYRDNKFITSRQIAKKLNVDYLVDGSGQKYGNSVSLMVHLINARTDKYMLSLPLEDNNEDEGFLFTTMANEVTSQIIDKVFNESKTKIGNLKSDKETAAFLLGKAQNLRSHGDLIPQLKTFDDSLAERIVNNSLQFDSTNAEAYNILSNIYSSRNRIDTASFLNEKALQLDKKNARAYCIKARLLQDDQYLEKKKLFEKSIKLDNKNSTPYSHLGSLYWDHGELANGLIFKYKALKKLGPLPSNATELQTWNYEEFMYTFCDYLIYFGYFKTAEKFANERIKLFRELNAGHVLSMLNGYLLSGRGQEAYNFGQQNKFPDYVHYNRLMGYVLMDRRKYDEAVKYLRRGIELTNEKFKHNWSFMMGYALIQTGQKEEGEKMLDMAIGNCTQRLNNLATSGVFKFMENYRTNPYISLASVYAVRGQKEKALEYLAMDRKTHPLLDLTGLKFLEEFPMLDNIRNEPEFKDYFAEAQKKFLNEKRKVERFLQKEHILIEE